MVCLLMLSHKQHKESMNTVLLSSVDCTLAYSIFTFLSSAAVQQDTGEACDKLHVHGRSKKKVARKESKSSLSSS